MGRGSREASSSAQKLSKIFDVDLVGAYNIPIIQKGVWVMGQDMAWG